MRRIELGPRYVECLVSGRWLEFEERAKFVESEGQSFVRVDVMTTTQEDERRRKLCHVIIGVEDLKRAIAEVSRGDGKPEG